MLDGVFAFCLLDTRDCFHKSKLFIARDPYGVRPMYIMNSNKKKNDSIYGISSELKQLSGMCDSLNKHTIDNEKNINKYDAFIALGCVIKGQTPHFEFISKSTTNAIMDLSINSKNPIGNGIITCLNMKQAKARRKKGAEAAKAVISVVSQK